MRESQALCFFAGANSIFHGNKLLTAKNPEADADVALLRELGLKIAANDTDGTDGEETGVIENWLCFYPRHPRNPRFKFLRKNLH